MKFDLSRRGSIAVSGEDGVVIARAVDMWMQVPVTWPATSAQRDAQLMLGGRTESALVAG